MSEYDKRQLFLMREKINGFKKNLVSLRWLIEDLEALLNVLEEKDQDWEGTFRAHWFDLEQVYAYALFKERDYLNEEEITVISEAIDELSKLIEIKLRTVQADE